MKAWPRPSNAVFLAAVLSVDVALPARPAPCSQEAGSNKEAAPRELSLIPPASPTPITDSIEPAVERFVRERLSPCGRAEGVPCFPVTLEVEGRRYSVRETLENLELDGRPAPGPPSAADMIQQGANPRPTSASVGFDPRAIACKTRQLLRGLQGRSRTYYLYRVWDETGERALLRDQPLDPEDEAGAPHVQRVPLGEFGDECEAIEAYRRATHEIRARREAEGPASPARPGLEVRSGDDPE